MHISDQLWDEFWKGLVMAIGLLIVLGLSTVIVKSASASGQVEYCYVEYKTLSDMPPVFQLRGHRIWRDDRNFGVFQTYEEAFTMSSSMKCPLLKKE